MAEEENADVAVENNPLTGTFYFKSVLDPSTNRKDALQLFQLILLVLSLR